MFTVVVNFAIQVDQLKAKVTNNPEFEEWDMQVYSRNNFNKARKGVMQYVFSFFARRSVSYD